MSLMSTSENTSSSIVIWFIIFSFCLGREVKQKFLSLTKKKYKNTDLKFFTYYTWYFIKGEYCLITIRCNDIQNSNWYSKVFNSLKLCSVRKTHLYGWNFEWTHLTLVELLPHLKDYTVTKGLAERKKHSPKQFSQHLGVC